MALDKGRAVGQRQRAEGDEAERRVRHDGHGAAGGQVREQRVEEQRSQRRELGADVALLVARRALGQRAARHQLLALLGERLLVALGAARRVAVPVEGR